MPYNVVGFCVGRPVGWKTCPHTRDVPESTLLVSQDPGDPGQVTDPREYLPSRVCAGPSLKATLGSEMTSKGDKASAQGTVPPRVGMALSAWHV